MTHDELIHRIAGNAGISLADTNKVYQALVEVVSKLVLTEDSVRLYGLGSINKTTRKERKGWNIAKGEPMTIPAQKSLNFKLSTKLKQSVK